jgi:hypothetical protein
MMFMRHLKYKKILLAIASLIILLGVGVLGVSFFNKSDGLILTPFPQDSDKYDYADLYEKEIRVGNYPVKLVVKEVTYHSEENGDWLYGEYQFYSTDGKKLLAKVGSLIPPEYDEKTGTDPFFSLKDITGDGTPEIFVMVQKASQVTSYQILQTDSDGLITLKEKGSQNDWVDFDTIEYKADRIYLTSHGSDSHTKVAYRLDEYMLVPIKAIQFKWDSKTTDESDCEVAEIDPKGGTVKVLENRNDCSVWTESFDPYFELDAPSLLYLDLKNITPQFVNESHSPDREPLSGPLDNIKQSAAQIEHTLGSNWKLEYKAIDLKAVGKRYVVITSYHGGPIDSVIDSVNRTSETLGFGEPTIQTKGGIIYIDRDHISYYKLDTASAVTLPGSQLVEGETYDSEWDSVVITPQESHTSMKLTISVFDENTRNPDKSYTKLRQVEFDISNTQ